MVVTSFIHRRIAALHKIGIDVQDSLSFSMINENYAHLYAGDVLLIKTKPVPLVGSVNIATNRHTLPEVLSYNSITCCMLTALGIAGARINCPW